MNALVVQVLEAEAGLVRPKTSDDLDDLFGTWVQDDAVDRALGE